MEQSEGSELLDARGLRCPEPVMLLHREFARLERGEELTVLATDPSTRRDFAQFCRQLGHELVNSSETDGYLVYVLRKGG